MHKEICDYLNNNVSGCSAEFISAEVGDSSIVVNASHILPVCESLKTSEFEFNVLQVITGTDYEERIEVSYILASFTKNNELILKVKLPKSGAELPEVESVCSVWNAANFLERETYDLVGVKFNNHPDHRRILCPYDWEGHALRKDYVVQETYLGMVVNPPEKVNNDDHFFFKEVEKKFDPKLVSHSWKE